MVDLKAMSKVFAALSNKGNLYAWGRGEEGELGIGTDGQTTNATTLATVVRKTPVRMLTRVHSFGTSIVCGWAVVAAGWRSGTDASDPTDSKNGATLVFWGNNQNGFGPQSGDPGLVQEPKYTPIALGGDLPKYVLYKNGQQSQGATLDDNTTLGVRMGSPEDGGTFQDIKGYYFGAVIRLKNGSIISWSITWNTVNGDWAAANGIPALKSFGQPIVGVATGTEWVFCWDAAGQAYFYGDRRFTDKFPDTKGAPNASPIVQNTWLTIDGGTSYPAWRKGEIAKIAGFGNTVIVEHTDESIYVAGGNSWRSDPPKNAYSLVRNYLLKQSTTDTAHTQPATLLDTKSH
ncbi:MAG: hypothetical protein LBR21_01510, partial [Propionibacteriaceae bacterium]|jgi:alpha-tubulin suppressor-like RCC1 family protein|nr:hypothetical protein [Propionibacteriaceae bacterium]